MQAFEMKKTKKNLLDKIAALFKLLFWHFLKLATLIFDSFFCY